MLHLGKPLKIGQVVSCMVLPGANTRSVPVTVNPEQVYTSLVCICASVYVFVVVHILRN